MTDGSGTPELPAGGGLARWLLLLRWPVVVVWVLAIVLLLPVAAGLSKLTTVTASGYLPSSAPSTRVVLLQEAALHGPGQPESQQAVVVFASRAGQAPLSQADLAAIASADRAVRRLAVAGTVTGLGAVSQAQRSADRRRPSPRP